MDQDHATLLVVVQQFLLSQPVKQFVSVRRLENLAQGVALFQALDVVPGRQQVQVVVTQHTHQ
ncbi:hypothetical protein D3C80_1075690 [compost metagenome]